MSKREEELVRVCQRLSAALMDEMTMHHNPVGVGVPDQHWNAKILKDTKEVLGADFIIATEATMKAWRAYSVTQ